MAKNAFSVLASRALQRIAQIAEDALAHDLPAEGRKRMTEELEFQKGTLETAFEFRKAHGPALGDADSASYFKEKLGSLISFAGMAVDPSSRERFGPTKISEHIFHYSYLVAKLVSADLKTSYRRPASTRAIKEASFDNRDALQRLVDR